MVSLVLVASAVEDAILNLFASFVSIPRVHPAPMLPVVNPKAGVVLEKMVKRLLGVLVPIPRLVLTIKLPVPAGEPLGQAPPLQT